MLDTGEPDTDGPGPSGGPYTGIYKGCDMEQVHKWVQQMGYIPHRNLKEFILYCVGEVNKNDV